MFALICSKSQQKASKMMGSPFYYDVLFDEGPGDVVFHDCMWSGICTCCIQVLHQDSYYQFAKELPDLKVEDLKCRTQLQQHQLHQQQEVTSSATSIVTGATTTAAHSLASAAACGNHHTSNNTSGLTTSAQHAALAPSSIAAPIAATITAAATATSIAASNHHIASTFTSQLTPNTSNRTSPDTSNSSSSTTSSSSSPASSLSPNSTSPKPIRRREHNDSERKRRDHLRNAFNFLRDQVPSFKQINKKPPRIQILHEATKYVQAIMRESEELERRLSAERVKHEQYINY